MTEAAAIPTTQSRGILLVDDDVDFTGMFREFLLTYRPGTWSVHTAQNYQEALACLKEHSVSLVVLDLEMPVMDGLQFLTLLKRSRPGLQVIILTGAATQENRTYCLQNGAALVLNKLDFVGGFDKITAALESVASTPTEGFRGMLRQVGLADVLQMECLNSKSSVLEINANSGSGRIYIENGAVIHAEAGALLGEKALFKLLALTGGEFQLRPFSKPAKPTIDGHWESLLMEAARLRDEEAATAPVAPAVMAPEPAAPLPSAPEETIAHPERFAEEIVLCSSAGEVLYAWQASGVEKRAQLLDLLAGKSNSLGRTLELGQSDRLVIETPECRVVALLDPEHKVFVRIGVKWT